MRLQDELHKTIVFVTHDFDEAVKLGDRIAVLRDRSHDPQYDTPDAILANPADDTVAGFVGAGASLKQLTLLQVRDVELRPTPSPPTTRRPGPVAERLRQAGATTRWCSTIGSGRCAGCTRELTGRTSLAEAGSR